jgi:hypothetical protein
MVMRIRNNESKGRTKFGMALEQNAREILAHVKGDVRLPIRRIVLPDEVDVKRGVGTETRETTDYDRNSIPHRRKGPQDGGCD